MRKCVEVCLLIALCSLLSVTHAEAGVVFGNLTNHEAGRGPVWVGAADVDGDGNVDLVVTNECASCNGWAGDHTIAVLRNDGSGNFPVAAPVTDRYTPPFSPGLADFCDFDCDGDIDLVVQGSWESHGQAFVLANDGSGHFSLAQTLGSPSNTGCCFFDMVIAGDVNSDGRTDVIRSDEAANAITVFLNSPCGTLVSAGSYTISAPTAMRTGDFDGDGDLDIAVMHRSGDVTVLVNDGTGMLTQGGTFRTSPDAAGGIATADLNGDHRPDLVIANNVRDSVTVLMNSGGGTFSAPVSYFVPSTPGSPVLADFDLDGHTDVATKNYSSYDVSILVNDGHGGLQPPVNFSLETPPYGPWWMCGADFDKDGRKDLAIANLNHGLVQILRNLSPTNRPPVASCQDVTVAAGPGCTASASVDAGSFDPDGDLVTLQQIPPGPYAVGSTQVMLIAADGESAPDTCFATVTVIDTTRPTVTCARDTIVRTALGDATAIVSYVTTATDNCPGVAVQSSSPSGSAFPGGSTTVTCVATDAAGNTDTCRFTVTVVITVAVDIKPRSCPNPLKIKGGDDIEAGVSSHRPDRDRDHDDGVLPVAVLGSATFDAADIDPASIRLETVAPLRHSYEDVAAPVSLNDDDGDDRDTACPCTDDGPDGYVDLTLKFSRAELAAAIGPVPNGAQVPLTLMGNLRNGAPITGTDCVLIRSKGKGDMYTGDWDLRAANAEPLVPWTSNYPNPFNAGTVIRYVLGADGPAKIEVFDILGRRVASLVDEVQSAGTHQVNWDGTDQQGNAVASGMYFYRLTAGNFVESKKMILLK